MVTLTSTQASAQGFKIRSSHIQHVARRFGVLKAQSLHATIRPFVMSKPQIDDLAGGGVFFIQLRHAFDMRERRVFRQYGNQFVILLAVIQHLQYADNAYINDFTAWNRLPQHDDIKRITVPAQFFR